VTVDRSEWNARYEAAELVWSASPNRLLVDEVAGLPPGRALDLAAGEGRNALWLAAEGWKVAAVDFAGAGLAKGRRRAEALGLAVEWIEADVCTWPAPPATFDLVAVLYLQLPAPQLGQALSRAAVALAPGGTLVVIGHDVRNLDEGVGGPQDRGVLIDPTHVAAGLAGLEVERAETVERPTDAGVALDALIRARALSA
jgi:SAM-dependent methyltransferase